MPPKQRTPPKPRIQKCLKMKINEEQVKLSLSCRKALGAWYFVPLANIYNKQNKYKSGDQISFKFIHYTVERSVQGTVFDETIYNVVPMKCDNITEAIKNNENQKQRKREVASDSSEKSKGLNF